MKVLNMEKIAGYARLLARTRVRHEVNKPRFGKPYMKYGQCYHIWSYFFQLGGILGAKYSTNLDAFGSAFLGASGPPGAVHTYFTEAAKCILEDTFNDSMTFLDFVGAEFIKRVGYSGNHLNFFMEHGMEKLPPETAEEIAWQYSDQGAALGAIHPHIIREMFDHTHKEVPKEKLELARSAGLNIPAEQDIITYEEIENGENEVFMEYCRDCCPQFYSILNY